GICPARICACSFAMSSGGDSFTVATSNVFAACPSAPAAASATPAATALNRFHIAMIFNPSRPAQFWAYQVYAPVPPGHRTAFTSAWICGECYVAARWMVQCPWFALWQPSHCLFQPIELIDAPLIPLRHLLIARRSDETKHQEHRKDADRNKSSGKGADHRCSKAEHHVARQQRDHSRPEPEAAVEIALPLELRAELVNRRRVAATRRQPSPPCQQLTEHIKRCHGSKVCSGPFHRMMRMPTRPPESKCDEGAGRKPQHRPLPHLAGKLDRCRRYAGR